jgi:hypothetical protein
MLTPRRQQFKRNPAERVLCASPKIVSKGNNDDPFLYPFMLPDGSGVIFNAGCPGPEHGVDLVEWPAELR